jgi:uncharacterized phage protein gp47/JayE
MPIQFPLNRKQVEDRAKSDVKSQLTQSNPWLKNSFLGALITGYAGRVYEFYLQLKNALLEMFPDTASSAYLERWGSYVSITRNPATQSTGSIVFTGVAATSIPSGTVLTSSDSRSYTTSTATPISLSTINITSLVRSGTLATATCSSDHLLATGMTVTVAGADQTEYNGSVVITVTSANSFTYSVTGSPTTPATGTITVSATSAYVTVTSVGYGALTNQVSGTQLTLASAISGVDSTAYVSFDEIGGGTDAESDEEYRARVLYRYQNPISLFNESSIKTEVFKRPGVTRAWVFEAGSAGDPISVSSITRSGSVATLTTSANHYVEAGQYVTVAGADQAGYNGLKKVLPIDDTSFAYIVDSTTVTPATGTITAAPSIPNGQVKVYFTRDNDASNIPTASEVTAVKTQVLTIKPANTATSDVIVKGPVAVPVDFTFTSLTPNTTAMRTAITNSLEALFSEEVNVGTYLQSHAYIAAIWQTVDNTGALVTDFELSTPTADVVIAEGEIPTLGTITFS